MAISNECEKIINIGIQALQSKKAENIVMIDISDISIIADAMVIASGQNINQLHAMADEIDEQLSKNKYQHISYEGYDKANWILMDYNDVIFQLFDKESRSFYNLERLYSDGIIKNINE